MTLLEILITLFIAAVLITIAVPNFLSLIQNNRISGATNEFVASINLARAEALKRGVKVFMCRTDDPSAIACIRSNPSVHTGNWSKGWLIYAVPSTRLVAAQANYAAGTDALIRIGEGVGASGVNVTSDSEGNNWLSFNADGTLFETSEVRYSVCDDRNEDFGRLIRIPLVGRAEVGDTTTADANDCSPI